MPHALCDSGNGASRLVGPALVKLERIESLQYFGGPPPAISDRRTQVHGWRACSGYPSSTYGGSE